MQINKNKVGTNLTLGIEGRLDTTTAPDLENVLKDSLDGVENLVIDFEKLEYISSAGLRIVLFAQKQMNKQGKMTLKNVNDEVKEVFDITGFSDIITIE